MSILRADGIEFGNGTQLTTFYGIIPQSSTMVFYQASAPTGWSKETQANDQALRVVDGTGGLSSGALDFSAVFTDAGADADCSSTIAGSAGDTTLTTQQLPAHTHNTGSNPNSYRSSAGSSPFRTDNRQPRGYNIRATTRTTINNRAIVNFRQPTNVRQPRNYRQPRRQRVPLRQRQPRNFRVRYDARSRNPFSFRVPVPFRSPLRARYPYSFRVPGGRWRNPIGQAWRASVRNNDRTPRRRWGRRRRNDRIPRRADRRQPRVSWWRQRRQFRQPRSDRNRRSYRQPRNYRQPVNSRQRRQTRVRQPNSFRVRYSFRQRNSFRVNIPFRVTVPQRNPAAYRQPRAYRTPQRYPQTTSVRVSQRILTPGGTIRNSNTQGPATSPTGGGQSHSHPFSGSPVSFVASLSPLRVQYIDVILCTLD
jgi:hypothetical protein